MQSEIQSGLHVAIIMDGNGRWATRRGMPRVAGHRAGVAALRHVVEHAPDLGIASLSLYAFSSDNWTRPAEEVNGIFGLMCAYLRLETQRLRQRGVRLQVIGRRDRVPALLRQEIETAELNTAKGECLHLRIAVDYSSRDAITRAAACAGSLSSGQHPLSPDSLRGMVTRVLTEEAGEVDLLIRTGGEKRLSDFLLWECAYAELFFTDCMWPDFSPDDLDAALGEFRRRERRFGSTPVSAPRCASQIGGPR